MARRRERPQREGAQRGVAQREVAQRERPQHEWPQHEWIDSQAALETLVTDLVAADCIAVDTEFHRERSYRPQLALVQIAFDDRVALVDPTTTDVAVLRAALDADILVVMHACAQDIEVLSQECGAIPSRLFDTQVAAGFLGMSTPSLAALVDRLLGVRLTKGDRLTDWFERPLRAAQQRYAADDAAYLIQLYDELCTRLRALNRWQWALDECEQWRRPPGPPPDPSQAWTRIKGARQLRGPQRAVAYRLAAWRERTASERDIPVRFVLSDMALLSIAQRRPRSVSELQGLRGVDGNQLRGRAGDRVIAEVARGLDMASGDIPSGALPAGPNVDAALQPAVPLVGAWVDEVARGEGIDRSLLATRSDIAALLAGDPASRLSTGWRAEVVGDGIRSLLAGEAALAFDPAEGLQLEPRPGGGPERCE
ncbi:ribonuclease D [Candidatus Poriferisodalis sp.]|uniref:ribonuclease D n=1 Tax=Candidatus Poriferisodalis sp. TaxID=3101277 RepID=UPI003B02C174